MAVSDVIVDYEQLELVVNDVKNHLSLLRTDLKNFKGNVKFDKKEWSGLAARTYNKEVVEGFTAYVQKYIDSVEQLQKDLIR